MKRKTVGFVFAIALAGSLCAAQVPPIEGSPTIDKPTLLDWPKDNAPRVPDLTEPTSNRLWDFHASVDDCEMVLSTAGNYHMALRDLWFDVYLVDYVPDLRNWYYTTSPPISPDQIVNGTLTIANLTANCIPQLAVGPGGLMDTLESLTFPDGSPVTEGERIPIIQNQGNVVLVKKGNPKQIQSPSDLGRADVRIVLSNPDTEPGSFGNYSESIFNMAEARVGTEFATGLFDRIFNSGRDDKWYAGERIHHREVPWSIAFGQADAGLMFYHLAKFATDSFPDLFEIVPLGGTVEEPDPVEGNRIGKLFVIRVNGDWTAEQIDNREALIEAFLSEEFTDILDTYGLVRPDDF